MNTRNGITHPARVRLTDTCLRRRLCLLIPVLFLATLVLQAGCPMQPTDPCANNACDDQNACTADFCTVTPLGQAECTNIDRTDPAFGAFACAEDEVCNPNVTGDVTVTDPATGASGTFALGVCVDCLSDNDCDAGETCVNNACVAGTNGVECENDDDCDEDEICQNGACVPEEPIDSAFAGSQACSVCHPGTFESFRLTGHPFKLNKVIDGVPPEYPVTTLAGPPPGIEWDDTAYVIGGFRWKYRVIDTNGFVVLGPTAQYNYPSQEFAPYNNDENHFAPPDMTPGPWETNIGRKDYACGPCHMTAYDGDTPNRLGLPGLIGDWEFDGIQCEECHGPGAAHAAAPSSDNINGSPDTDTSCGKCHTRSSAGIAASGGFIRHHEQWDEYSRTGHAGSPLFANGCMTCHDVHEPIFDSQRLAAIQAAADGDPTAVDGLPVPPGIIIQCTACHGGVTVVHPQVNGEPIECISCHMAYTGKSAQAINANMGDIMSHAWKINDDADALMFTDAEGNPVPRDSGDTAFAALDDDGEPFITLDFACLRCHTDQDVDWAAANADAIHGE